MKLYCKCKNCKDEISLTSSNRTRVEFAMNLAENIKLECNNCNNKYDYHVNNLYAKESKTVLVISFIVFIIGTPILGYFIFINPPMYSGLYSALIIGSFLLIPVLIYGILMKQDRTRVSVFNRHRL